jgi:hypothetical protein
MALLLSSCSNLEKIKFEPDPFVFSPQTDSIVNADSKAVNFYSRKIYQYGCFHQDDFKRLAAILSAARIPKKYKDILQKELDKINNKKKRALRQGR